MKNQEIDILVELSLNPYLVVKMEIEQNKEETDIIEESLINNVDPKFINEYEKNIIDIEINQGLNYMFIKQNFYNEFIKKMKSVGYKFKITDALNEIWEMDNLSLILDKLEKDNDPEFTKENFPDLIFEQDKVLNILKTQISQKYSIDDVIDKISNKGIESLNELNKYILDKESH